MLDKNQEMYNYIFYYDNILRENFFKADKDGDGYLNFFEYHNLLNSYGYEISTKETSHRFNQVDLNQDGLISFEGILLNFFSNIFFVRFIFFENFRI
jgi:Ca2+-binding EF-hand superfamily protein